MSNFYFSNYNFFLKIQIHFLFFKIYLLKFICNKKFFIKKLKKNKWIRNESEIKEKWKM